MATQDSHVQVATDGSGKKVDNATLTREATFDPAGEPAYTAGVQVYRQRVVLSSDEDPALQAQVSGEAGRGVLSVEAVELGEIRSLLLEIRDLLRFTVGA